MITTNLRARNLEEAWLRGMKEIMDKGREYRKDDSTRAGMLRKALDFLSIEITHPEDRPLVPLSKPGCISTCSEADAERYLLEKLYTTEDKAENEAYTYAQYLTRQIEWATCRYADKGFYTQKAVMTVGSPYDLIGDSSIPCLRMIDTRIINVDGLDRLHYYIYFRAWNWFGAFPLEMAGFQMLKEMHCCMIEAVSGKPVAPGPTVCMSKDAHVNDIEWDAARAWLGE